MSFDRDPFSPKELLDDNIITKYLKLSFEDISGMTTSEKCNLWAESVNIIFSSIKNSDNVDFSRIFKVFDIDSLAFIHFNSSVASHDYYVSRYLTEADPKSRIILEIELTTWQWYDEKSNPDVSFEVFKSIYHINEKSFFDDRFSVFPIFTQTKQGRDRSPWIKDIKEGFVSFFDEDINSKVTINSDKSAYNSIFMDAKLGFLICFKDKPSMVVSFNFDNDKNILIHQIQSKPKDRGHYKIKNWQNYIINFISSLFNEFNVKIISGKSVSELVAKGYEHTRINDPEIYKIVFPSSETFDRIKNNYDSLSKNKKTFSKNNVFYHYI